MNLIALPTKLMSQSKTAHKLIHKTFNKKQTLTLVLSAALMSATPLMAEDTVLATVNGQDITESQLKIAATQSKVNYKEITPEQKKLLTEALINRQLVLQEAIKADFDKDKDVAARVKALTDSYIAANYLAKIAKEFKVSEEDIKAYYEKEVVNNRPKEYKARHILVKTEDEAKQLIKEIEGGADFSKLAKEKSIDTGSGSQGGSLEWFAGKDMVAPFSKAVADLKKGEMSKMPVNSQFGWHVVILDDERTPPPPELNDVKENIKKVLIKEKLNQYLSDLNSNSKVTIK